MIKQMIQKQLIKLCRECQSAMLQPPIIRCGTPATASETTTDDFSKGTADTHNTADSKVPIFEIIKGGRPYPAHFTKPRTVKRDTLQKIIAISDAYKSIGQPLCSKN